MFRIIAGKWKAKRIAAPKNFDVRPTTDFAKEALFSMIENRFDLEFCSALDLFAGIGSITLELASRDCNDITSVELNPKHAGFISTTANELDMGLQVNVQRADVFDWLKRKRNHEKKYDIIFADAPFETDEKKYNELIDLVLKNELLKPNGIFILEHQSKQKYQHPNLKDSRKYGNINFSFFESEPISE